MLMGGPLEDGISSNVVELSQNQHTLCDESCWPSVPSGDFVHTFASPLSVWSQNHAPMLSPSIEISRPQGQEPLSPTSPRECDSETSWQPHLGLRAVSSPDSAPEASLMTTTTSVAKSSDVSAVSPPDSAPRSSELRCRLCRHRFKRRATLKSHMVTHERDREMLKCPHVGCSKTFKRAGDRNRHLRNVCPFCIN